jgi:hypothetical protein
MTTPLLRFTIAASAAAVAATVLATPAVASPDYVLNASGIEQTVLRAQMPKTLGSWGQNIYFTWAANDKRFYPTVCYSAKGPLNGGGVGYSVSPQITGSDGLFQYADKAAADAALAALRKADCPDTTKVKTDVGTVVKGQQGTDFTDSSQTGIESSATYRYDGGAGMTSVMEFRMTTQVGLTIVQTEVTLSGDAATTKNLDRAAQLNRKWHAQALAAYNAFGSGSSH